MSALLAIAAVAGLGVAAWRFLFPWIGYDIQYIKTFSKNVKGLFADVKTNTFFIDNFEATVRRTPKKTFLIYEDKSYTYEFVNDQACRVANIVSGWGLKKGDAVALFIHNSPEYIWTFLGLQKLGVIASMLNINTRGEPLLHCMKITDTVALIVGDGSDLLEAINSIKDDLSMPIYVMGDTYSPNQSWDALMVTSSSAEVGPSVRKDLTMLSISCYAFTSGTTGLPKAALVFNWRVMGFGKLLKTIDLQPNDVLYDVLPFYHLIGAAGWFSAADTGCTVVIRKKFSAGHFFEDCRKYNVTTFQYIGELCRYLLAQPENPMDGNHKIRAIIGVGLRKDIWFPFKQRFNIPVVLELFGASESPISMGNIADRPGAVGRLSPLLAKVDPYPKYLIKFDAVTNEPIRDKQGRCIQVKTGEPGLLIGTIMPLFKVGFYKGGQELDEKRILRNVFKEGDVYCNTWDILSLDKDYFAYFHDRLGDTFRWKGENVSTTEVSNIMTALSFIQDANVYGVSIPGHDGKGGMASVTLVNTDEPDSEKLKAIYRQCKQHLPRYAIPLVLRFEKETRITSTFKQHKVDLMKEGFDPKLVSDPMYYLSTEEYLPLNSKSYDDFVKSRL